MQHSANVEAITSSDHRLRVAQNPARILPSAPNKNSLLQITLGVPVRWPPKALPPRKWEKTYTRALELCQQVGETPQLFPVLLGCGGFIRAGRVATARELGEQILGLAQRAQDSGIPRGGPRRWEHLVLSGELAAARAHLEQAMALYDSSAAPLPWLRLWMDLGVYLPLLCSLGPVASWAIRTKPKRSEALTLAQELSHPLAWLSPWTMLLMLHQLRRERATQERAEAAIALSTEQGFPLWLAQGAVLRGWALAEQGQGRGGNCPDTPRPGRLPGHRGRNVARPYYLALLAEAYGKAGQVEEGLTVLAEALATVDKTGERFYEAELYRLRGELTLRQFKVKVQSAKLLIPAP